MLQHIVLKGRKLLRHLLFSLLLLLDSSLFSFVITFSHLFLITSGSPNLHLTPFCFLDAFQFILHSGVCFFFFFMPSISCLCLHLENKSGTYFRCCQIASVQLGIMAFPLWSVSLRLQIGKGKRAACDFKLNNQKFRQNSQKLW